MEKKSKRANTFLIFYGVMLVLFFVMKWFYLQNNDVYNGKVTSISSFGVSYDGDDGQSYYPRVEYYRNKDTLGVFDRGWNATFIDEGDEITVVVNKNDESDVQLNTLFNYWIPLPTIILLIFILGIEYAIEVTDLSK